MIAPPFPEPLLRAQQQIRSFGKKTSNTQAGEHL